VAYLSCPAEERTIPSESFVFEMPSHTASDHGNYDHFSIEVHEVFWVTEQMADPAGTGG
jgi:hypothetical protein